MPTLFVAAVSINDNPRDISPVTLKHIAAADIVIGEERKMTLRLLAAADAREKEYYLLNEHSTDADRTELFKKILTVETAVFFSDSGTPCISDPDYHFISMCRDHDIKISSLAGASSIAAALSISGLDASNFLFLGFPPKGSSGQRKRFFEELKKSKYTTIFMERPYSLMHSLQEMIDFEFKIFLAINLSSDDEQCYFDKPRNIISVIKIKKAPFIVIIPKQAK